MGWFWSSTPVNGTANSSSPSSPPPPAAPQRQPTRDEIEIAKFMGELKEAAAPRPSRSQPAPPPPPPPPAAEEKESKSSWLSWASAPAPAEPPKPPKTTRSPESLAMSEHLYPTTMSCRDAFDYAWHCQSPGGQVSSVYRDGGLRQCSELWDDFWFCMRIKSYSPEQKAEAIRDHFRQKERLKYDGKPSSEDIWESRSELVQPGTAFTRKFDPPITDDAKFAQEEEKRRQRVREYVQEMEGRKQ
ncbi:hypothetical protein QBC35DRAFT_230568 [Podospora australis]|uniref:Early meiotic induction protein 1 n=1 Tax=Podospora australis TaxID=1536484 RepID=A0AAN7AJ68_9PEZI|nr:hypothetical protein QBC35DRAFT_230568 [Podospora australis]